MSPLFLTAKPNRCRWPLWNGPEPLETKRICGKRTERGQSYCDECRKRAKGGAGDPLWWLRRRTIALPRERGSGS